MGVGLGDVQIGSVTGVFLCRSLTPGLAILELDHSSLNALEQSYIPFAILGDTRVEVFETDLVRRVDPRYKTFSSNSQLAIEISSGALGNLYLS